MKTLNSLLNSDELKELSKLNPKTLEVIGPILHKPFKDITISELETFSRTGIFDAAFVDLIFTDLYNRFK